MSGHVGDLSPKQQGALDQLRENIKDVWDDLPEDDDYFFLRWLRARNFDVAKTESFLREHLVTAKKWKFKELLDWEPPEALEKYFCGRLLGFDRRGSPVFYQRLGKCDLRGLVRSATREDFVRRSLQDGLRMMKCCKEQSEKLGRRVDTVVVIHDLEGLSLKQHFYQPGIDTVIEIVKMFEANFPEILNTVYCINVPKIFSLAYAIVKPFFNEVTRQKVRVLSGTVESYGEVLRQAIDPSDLPVCYGGTLAGPGGDVNCDAMLCSGGEVPPSYYIHLPENDNTKDATIARASLLQVDVSVKTPGSKLLWDFASEDYNIGFCVLRKSKDFECKECHAGQLEEVVPAKIVDSHLCAQTGSLICDQPGIYVVRFSNTHSWLRSKTIHYSVRLEEAKTSVHTQRIQGSPPKTLVTNV